MRKVKTNRRNRIFGLFAMFAMAIGVGVSLAPKEVVKTEASSPLTLDKLGTGLGDAYSDDVQQTTVNEYVLNYKQGKKQGDSIILAKSTGAFISNKTPLPGKITSVEVFINIGAAGKTTYRVNFSDSEVLSDPGSGTAVNIAGGNSSTFTNTSDATYFVVSLGNTNNGQVLKLVISYSTAAQVDATDVNVTAAGEADSVLVGGTLQLSAEVLPNPGASQVVTWSSNKPGVATVDENSGVVTGVSAGDVTITATSTTPGVSGSISLTVPEPIVYDGFETFENHDLTGSSYVAGSYEGDEVTITYAGARKEETFGITDKGIMFGTTAGYIEFDLPNGISAIKFDWKKAYTGGGDRQLGVYVNGNHIVSTPTKDETDTQTFEYLFATPFSGSTKIKIANMQDKQVVIDNLAWLDGPELTFGTLDSISLNTSAVKDSYYETENLSLAGLVVMAVDTNGIEKNVTGDITANPADNYLFTNADALAGTKKITISYTEGKTVSESFNVTVLPILQPEHLISNVGLAHDEEGDLGTAIALGTDLKGVFTGPKISLLESAIVQTDGEDTLSRMYYAGTNNIKAGVQPLKFGASGGKGNVKFTFTKEIAISKVTLYVARLTTGGTNSTMQVNSAPAQTIGVAGQVDAMHVPYAFSGEFGHEITIRNNTNVAAYLFGVDIEYTLSVYGEANEFANHVMGITDLGDVETDDCETNFLTALLEWDELSPEAKTEFKTNDDFADARQRFNHWALVNGYTLNDIYGSGVQAESVTNNPINATLIIGLLGLTSMAGYYFLTKKEKLVK